MGQLAHSVLESKKIRKIEVSLTRDLNFPSVEENSFFGKFGLQSSNFIS